MFSLWHHTFNEPVNLVSVCVPTLYATQNTKDNSMVGSRGQFRRQLLLTAMWFQHQRGCQLNSVPKATWNWQYKWQLATRYHHHLFRKQCTIQSVCQHPERWSQPNLILTTCCYLKNLHVTYLLNIIGCGTYQSDSAKSLGKKGIYFIATKFIQWRKGHQITGGYPIWKPTNGIIKKADVEFPREYHPQHRIEWLCNK